MSHYFDPILFSVNLAFNLLLLGCLITGGVVVSFQLIKNANPRLRYVVVVTAFLCAAFLPLAVTLDGSVEIDGLIKQEKIGNSNFAREAFFDATFPAASKNAPSISKPEPEKISGDFLNDFAAAIAGSLIGRIIFSLWILGAFCLLLRDIFAVRQLKKRRQSRREAAIFEREELSVPDKIPLYFGNESPATIGLIYPIIVLPEEFPCDLSLAQKRAIVRHEASHATWRDPLVGFILRLIRAVFWISPALWLLERIAVGERERAADQSAVANCAENESQREAAALDFAATLVSMARHFNFNAPPRESSGANIIGLCNGSILESRIRRLLIRSSKTTRLHVLSALAVFAVSLAGLHFMPIAYQSEKANFQAPAAVADDPQAKELNQNDNENNLQAANRQTELLPIVKISEAEKVRTLNTNRKENQLEQSAATDKQDFQIPYIVMVRRSSPGKADSAQSEMPIYVEKDAKASGMNQKLDELSNKVQNLEDSRKNLESSLPQVRRKAAGQVDSPRQRLQTTGDSGRKSN